MSAEQKFSAEEEEEALAAALETAACRQRPRCLAAKDRDSMTVERETTKTKTKMKGMSSTKAPTWPRTRSAVLRDGVELGPSPKARRLDKVFLSPTRPEPDFFRSYSI